MSETTHGRARGARWARSRWRSRLLLWLAAGLTTGLAAACSSGGGGGSSAAPSTGTAGDWDSSNWDQFDWS